MALLESLQETFPEHEIHGSCVHVRIPDEALPSLEQLGGH